MVESQVIRWVFHEAPRVAVQDQRVFQRVVKAAFAQRRKTLRNALRAANYQNLEAIEKETEIDLQRRGETLNLSEFSKLANALSLHKP
jgi:16S rRNA (adenine1518-N6/adenine1519-N6)-dimethyltransferase